MSVNKIRAAASNPYWFNYTGRPPVTFTGMPTTDEEALQLVPPWNPAAAPLYNVYRQMGHSIPEALVKVPKAVVAAHESDES